MGSRRGRYTAKTEPKAGTDPLVEGLDLVVSSTDQSVMPKCLGHGAEVDAAIL